MSKVQRFLDEVKIMVVTMGSSLLVESVKAVGCILPPAIDTWWTYTCLLIAMESPKFVITQSIEYLKSDYKNNEWGKFFYYFGVCHLKIGLFGHKIMYLYNINICIQYSKYALNYL